MKSRTLFELLLTATLGCGAYYLFIYVPKYVKVGEPVVALANYFLTYAPIQEANEPAYVVPDSLELWDTPAEIRSQVATLKSGEEGRLLGHFRDWAHVQAFDGRDGWVSDNGLMNFETHAAEERLLSVLSEIPAQATGEPVDVENVHIGPSRAAPVVTEVNPECRLEILGRRMVQRSFENYAPDILPVPSSHLEAWYLVREGSHSGWILGRRVQLAIPKSISAYAQDTNLVAWLVLDTVTENGHLVPQYVVAERVGSVSCDFTEIQVLTGWKRKETYAVAFREEGLQGYFPILVMHEGSVPYFRLRLVDDDGNKCQKIFALFDTITRPIGIADSWASDAMPEQTGSRIAKRQPRPQWSTGG